MIFAVLLNLAASECQTCGVNVDIGRINIADFKNKAALIDCSNDEIIASFSLNKLSDHTLGFMFTLECWGEMFNATDPYPLPFESDCNDPAWTRSGVAGDGSDSYKSERECVSQALSTTPQHSCAPCNDDNEAPIGFITYDDVISSLALSETCSDDISYIHIQVKYNSSTNVSQVRWKTLCPNFEGFFFGMDWANDCNDATSWTNAGNLSNQVEAGRFSSKRYCVNEFVQNAISPQTTDVPASTTDVTAPTTDVPNDDDNVGITTTELVLALVGALALGVIFGYLLALVMPKPRQLSL